MDLTFDRNFMLPKFGMTCFTCESMDSKLEKECKIFLARKDLELLRSGFLCVAPLWLGELRGKKNTSSIDWEVSVKSL
jgi:hypothetical protein